MRGLAGSRYVARLINSSIRRREGGEEMGRGGCQEGGREVDREKGGWEGGEGREEGGRRRGVVHGPAANA